MEESQICPLGLRADFWAGTAVTRFPWPGPGRRGRRLVGLWHCEDTLKKLRQQGDMGGFTEQDPPAACQLDDQTRGKRRHFHFHEPPQRHQLYPHRRRPTANLSGNQSAPQSRVVVAIAASTLSYRPLCFLKNYFRRFISPIPKGIAVRVDRIRCRGRSHRHRYWFPRRYSRRRWSVAMEWLDYLDALRPVGDLQRLGPGR